MIQTNRKLLSISIIIRSLILFTVVWSVVTDAWGISTLLFGLNRTSWQKLSYDILSRIVWVLPLFFYIQRYNSDLPISFKQLFKKPIHLYVSWGFFIAFLLYGILTMFITHGKMRINPHFHFVQHILFYLVVAFVEEIVYRGWALNALSRFMTNSKAIVLSVVFFMLLHWPAYLIKYCRTGVFETASFILHSIVVLATGTIFSIVFLKNKSLWTPLLLHAFFDIWVYFLAG